MLGVGDDAIKEQEAREGGADAPRGERRKIRAGGHETCDGGGATERGVSSCFRPPLVHDHDAV